MNPRFLLDTHVLVRWISEPRKLSRGQTRIITQAFRRGEPVAISAMTLLEIALLLCGGKLRTAAMPVEVLAGLEANPLLQVLPLDFGVAAEIVNLANFRGDPADRAIVATARARNLKLLTSDQRIIESNLVPIIE